MNHDERQAALFKEANGNTMAWMADKQRDKDDEYYFDHCADCGTKIDNEIEFCDECLKLNNERPT